MSCAYCHRGHQLPPPNICFHPHRWAKPTSLRQGSVVFVFILTCQSQTLSWVCLHGFFPHSCRAVWHVGRGFSAGGVSPLLVSLSPLFLILFVVVVVMACCGIYSVCTPIIREGKKVMSSKCLWTSQKHACYRQVFAKPVPTESSFQHTWNTEGTAQLSAPHNYPA
jgi:hypothetical protein